MASPTWPSFTRRETSTSSISGARREQEMRVHRDAVAADPEARLVDVAVGLAVGGLDDLLDVDPDPLGVAGELVGEGDVHVAIGRVGELAELGRLGAAHPDDLRVEDRGVEGGRPVAGGRPDPADELGVGGEVAEDGPAVQALRAEGDEEVLVGSQAAAPPRGRGVKRSRVSPTGSVVSKMTVEPRGSRARWRRRPRPWSGSRAAARRRA